MRTSVRESFYGDVEPFRGGSRLFILVGPSTQVAEGRIAYGKDDCLEFDIPELRGYVGKAVLAVTRYCDFPESTWDDLKLVPTPPGLPEFIVGVSFDPSKTDGQGAWQGNLKGIWPVRLRKIRKPTFWERLRS
jgi:hypothetical protein